MHQNPFRLGLGPSPLDELTKLPRFPNWILGGPASM